MPYYKDQLECLHFLSDTDVFNGGELLLPSGCVQITEENAYALQMSNQEENQLHKNNAARQYLTDTDWYVIRNIETGKPIPGEVLEKRSNARNLISE